MIKNKVYFTVCDASLPEIYKSYSQKLKMSKLRDFIQQGTFKNHQFVKKLKKSNL